MLKNELPTRKGGCHMSDYEENSEMIVNSDCMSDAEAVGQALINMSQGDKAKLNTFLEAVNFLDKWKEPA